MVVRFVQDISLNPPTLLELAARTVRTTSISYGPEDLPRTMMEYLQSANCCVNPKCAGMWHISTEVGLPFFQFDCSFQVCSLTTVSNILNLLIFVENTVCHYCNIYVLPSKTSRINAVRDKFIFFFSLFRCIEPAKKFDEPQAGASGFMMRKVLLG